MRVSATRLLVILLASLSVLVLLWLVLAEILQADRGFDVTEEGMYLISADPPVRWATWRFPFGWHTQPLFALVGFDIGQFRVVGAMILVLSAGALGWVTARTVLKGGRQHLAVSQVVSLMVLLIAAGGSLLYYAPFLRTPSYNWLALVGLIVAMTAALWAVGAQRSERRLRALPEPREFAAAVVASLALFAALPAKPPAALLGLALTAALMTERGWRAAVRWTVLLMVLILAWISLAVLVGLWPANFASVFGMIMSRPPQDERSSVSWAVMSLMTAPRSFAGALSSAETRPFVLLLLAGAALIAPLLARRTWFPLRVTGVVLTCVAAASMAGAPVPFISPTLRAMGWASPAIAMACLLVLLAVLLARVRLAKPASPEQPGRSRSPRWWVVTTVLALMPLAYAFGSDNGAFGQSAGAAGLVLLGAAVPAMTVELRPRRICLVSIVLTTTLVITSTGLLSGRVNPYVNPDLEQQTVSTQLGSHGAQLNLSPGMADRIAALREAAIRNGWETGTPMVDLTYALNPGYPYALGGRVPNTVMLTAFGFNGSVAIAEENLGHPNEAFPFDDAWILTDRATVMSEGVREAVSMVAELTAARANSVWPEGYGCVEVGDLILWKPKGADSLHPSGLPGTCGF
jgi:hypothetical protein